MQIRWTSPAIDEFAAQIEYIFRDDPKAARETATSILRRIDRLLIFPGIGRKSARPNTRELVVPPFIVVYAVRGDTVQLLHFQHSAQERDEF